MPLKIASSAWKHRKTYHGLLTFPNSPWSRVHIDFAYPINGLSFLVVDAHSKWPEIFPMQQTDTRSTIAILRRLFSQHGLPETLVSVTGLQFTSLFRDVCISPVHNLITYNPTVKLNVLWARSDRLYLKQKARKQQQRKHWTLSSFLTAQHQMEQ